MDVQVAQQGLKTNFYISPKGSPSDILIKYEGQEKMYLTNGNLIVHSSLGDIVELKPYAYQETDTGRREIPVRYRLNGDLVSFMVGEYDNSETLVIDPVLIFSTFTGSSADNWGTTATYDFQKNTYTAGLVFGAGYPVSLGVYRTSSIGNADIGIFKFDSTGSQRLYATYLGGTLADMPHSLYVNTFDELVVFGTTGSSDFPTTIEAYDTTFNGGSLIEYEGSTSIHFPNGSDIFVCRFNNDGSQLQASTYIGSTSNDGLNYRNGFNDNRYTYMVGNDSLYYNYGDGARGELITDDLNNVYVGSTTFSAGFPTTPGSIQTITPHPGKQNGVVFKLDYNLRNLIWSTFLGGNGDDAVYSIDVDSNYNVIVCGGTNSTNFPVTPDAYQTTYGGGSADGFVSKISYNGDMLLSSTYYGSPAYDQAYFVRCGRHNEVFIYGQTKASDSTMIYNAEYGTPNSGMLLARLLPDLSAREWSTVFGTPTGRPNLSPTAFAADICNRVYAAGWGRDFVGFQNVNWNQRGTTNMEITSDAIQSTTDGQDFYIISIDEFANGLEFATYFGELHENTSRNGGHDHVDGGTSRFDKLSTLYQSVCGSCYQNDEFPTTYGAWSRHNNSNNCNNALFRLNIHNDFPVAECVTPPVGCAPYEVNFVNTGRGTSFHWDFGDGSTSTQRNPQHTFTESGYYTIQLIAYQDGGCRTTDTCTIKVLVLGAEGHRHNTTSSCDGEPIQIGTRPMPGCSYHWITPGVSDNSVANPYVYAGGTYLLEITSLEGCTEVDTFEVNFFSLLDTLIIVNPTCPGYSDGYAIVHLIHDTVHANYYWDGQPGDSILNSLSGGTTHTLYVERRGCTFEISFTIQDPPVLEYTIDATDILCQDECNGHIYIKYQYPDMVVGDTLLENLCEGTYTINFTDTAGCPYSATATIIKDSSLWNARIWADDTLFFLSESVGLHVTPFVGATYQWTGGSTLDHDNRHNPIATPVDTISVYECTITDSLGCTWHGSIALHCTEVICGRPNIFIPNSFTPNGDGTNDKLCFHGNFVLDFYLAIYSRWGEKVFETHDINDCWDGHYNGTLCQPGVYNYYCKIKCEAGFENLLKGDITLIR